MSKMSGTRNLTAILSIVTDRRRAFVRRRQRRSPPTTSPRTRSSGRWRPAKKPLTRGLSVGPQADPAATAAEAKFVQTIRGRATRSLSVSRARGNRHHRQGQAEYRSGNHLRLQLGRHQQQIAALGSGARPGADQSRPEGLDLRRRRPHRRRRRRSLQSGPVRAARRLDQALPDRQIRHRRRRPRDRRLRQEQAEGSEPAAGGSEPPRAGGQYGEQDHRVQVTRQVDLA